MVKLAKKRTRNKPLRRKTNREHILPYPEFPLFPQGSGRWAKKIRGKLHYFGRWDSPDGDTKWQAALDDYKAKIDDLQAGRTPRVKAAGLTLADLANQFLTAKRHLVDTSELTPRSFADYYATCQRVLGLLGKNRLVVDLAADDFELLRSKLAKTLGPVSLGNEIQRIRVLFKYGYDAVLLDRPVRYGPTFKRPSKKTLRRAKQQRGPRMFEAPDLRRILKKAGQPLRAMILLGINAGFGNQDVAALPIAAVDLDAGWVDYPRPKTAVDRCVPLWPETIAALREVLSRRPVAKNGKDTNLVFITKYGHSWSKADALQIIEEQSSIIVKGNKDSPISKEMAKLLKELKLHRPRLNFYALRHTFETIGGEAKDQIAVDAIMGHVDTTMAGEYRERISDKRLKAVTDHVRNWLLTEGRGKKEKKPRGGWRLL